MFKTSLPAMLVITAVAFGPAIAEPLSTIYETSAPPAPVNQIDKIVFAKLASLKIRPVVCSDAVFVRRAYLDVIGKLPTAAEARTFIENKSRNKRTALIDDLLKRDEFADYWSMKWGDVLRIKAEFPINLWPNAAQAYHRWVRHSIAQNKPYDQFAREMLTSSGSNFRVGPVNFYRAIQNKNPDGIANAVALTFMGSRTDSWPKERLANMTVFFSQIGYKPTSEWKEENVFWDPLKASAATDNIAPGHKKPTTVGQVVDPAKASKSSVQLATITATLPDGTRVRLSPDRDPREVFADWLINPKNPWFARSIVNRTWAWLLGRGIIHEPDDIRDDNPPSNPRLLAYLESELVNNDYDLRHLYRLILTSRTYQLSSIQRIRSDRAQANFANYPLRRLDAEVLIDAVNQVTGTKDLYTSPIPEPFTYIPPNMSAVSIADGSITSPFLALFGRSSRATGMSNERNNKQTSAQWLHMLNSGHIQRKLEQSGKIRTMFASSGGDPKKFLEELYLTILSRFPTKEEVQIAMSYGQPTATPGTPGKAGKPNKFKKPSASKRKEHWIDVTWALINSPEFLFRH